jgi:hypothetical protein
VTDLIKYVVGSLVEHPDEVRIEERSQRDETVFEVTVNPEDRGRVIGKSGQTIHALRSLVAAAAALKGVNATVDVTE